MFWFLREMGNCLKCFKGSSENSTTHTGGLTTSNASGQQNSDRIRSDCNERGGEYF